MEKEGENWFLSSSKNGDCIICPTFDARMSIMGPCHLQVLVDKLDGESSGKSRRCHAKSIIYRHGMPVLEGH